MVQHCSQTITTDLGRNRCVWSGKSVIFPICCNLESSEKSRGLRGPVLSLPKDYPGFSLVNLRALRILCGFFGKVISEISVNPSALLRTSLCPFWQQGVNSYDQILQKTDKIPTQLSFFSRLLDKLSLSRKIIIKGNRGGNRRRRRAFGPIVKKEYAQWSLI